MRLVRDEPILEDDMEMEPVGDADGPVEDAPEELDGDAENSDSLAPGELALVDSRLLEALLFRRTIP